MTVRLPAVEDVLGAPIGQLTAADLQRAVEDHVRELPDLDFKQTRYENPEELAKDVAAMANTTGGLLVLGIREENGAAQEVTPVALSDSEERRMHQGLRSRTVPFIPEVVIRPVVLETSEAGEQTGFYFIIVGRSLLAPHGVMAQGDEKKKTYWPVRDGTTTRYLSEPELAEFYRRRFRNDEARERELDKIWDEGTARIYPDRVWLAAAAVPSLPGRLPAGAVGVHQVQGVLWKWADEFWPQSSLGLHLREGHRIGRFVPGVRRTMWDADSFERRPHTAFAEFHRSGAGFAAVALSEQASDIVLNQTCIEAELLGLLYLLGCHTREARASGDLILLAGLYTHDRGSMSLGRQRVMSTVVDKIPGVHLQAGPFYAEPFSIGLDELLSYEGAARVTYQFAIDIAGRFGVPDAGLVTERGTLRQDSGGLAGFYPWAESAGLMRETSI